ncbi:MAG: hypothetical protein QXE43_00905 [Candidatus Aenigmatarchaeota archaeon]|nr:hypothetical protein [Candidatus Aenigmarchaeota archaeon]
MDIFDILKLIVTKIFFTKASIDDIRTTEIRDIEVYFFISLLVILNLIQILYYKDFNILYSLLINLAIFGFFGFFLYFSGQWGLGDSFLLLSLGLLNIFKNIFEILNWLLITFSVGVFFIFFYSVLFVFLLKKYEKLNLFSKISLFISLFFSFLSLYFLFNKMTFNFLISFLILLYVSIPFLKSVKDLMIKRISINKLKEGDVLLDFKVWRGITKKEIEELKRKKIKYVYIKEGVRYAPTFLFTLILIVLEKIFGIVIFDFFPKDFFLI